MSDPKNDKKATYRIEDAADTEGHRFHGTVGEATEALDDTEGHKFHGVVGEATEALDDTEGHRLRTGRGDQSSPDGTTYPRSV
jgi:hypothetical protein